MWISFDFIFMAMAHVSNLLRTFIDNASEEDKTKVIKSPEWLTAYKRLKTCFLEESKNAQLEIYFNQQRSMIKVFLVANTADKFYEYLRYLGVSE